MHAAIALGSLAFLFCLILTPVCRNIFLRLGIVDHPDALRKLHTKPVPRVGGLAIALSYALALGVLVAFAPHGLKIFIRHKALLLSLVPPVCLVFAVGLLDDLVGLRPRTKLAGQAVAAILAVAFGARITLVGGHPAALWITAPLSVLWLLACSNALNLIDGVDGLAAGVGLFATLTTLLAALLQGNMGLVLATVPLAACLLAFLRYNFNPASVFLGDCGSLTVGFLLGCFGLIWSQKSATFLGMAAPMMALALPLIDVSLSIVRRYLNHRPIFQADRGHIHHRLLALGFTPRSVALLLYGVCGIAASFSLLHSIVSHRFQGLVIIVFCCLVAIGVNRLEYAEFSVVKELLSRRTFLRILQERIYLENLRTSIETAETLEDCWVVACNTCRDLKFAAVHMEFQGRLFAEDLHSTDEEHTWKISVSLGESGSLNLMWAGEQPTPAATLVAVRALQQCFLERQAMPVEQEDDLVYH